MTDLLTAAAKQHAVLFEVSWHNSIVRYTNWAEDVVVSPATYLSEPRIGIRLPREQGGVTERPAQLDWPITLPPADTLTSQPAHPRVQVKVWEILPGDDATLRALYMGWVARTRRGKGGNKDIAVFQLDAIKATLKSPLGVLVMRTCSWRFGDANCQKLVIPTLQETGTVATVTDDVITITGLTTTTTAEYWFRGWVEIDGLRLAIRRYDTPDVFYLARRPPPNWAAQSILCTPGCDKTLSVCKERWDNIEHFAGLGFAMPARHPQIEFSDVSLKVTDAPTSILGEIDGLTGLYDSFIGVRSAISAGALNAQGGFPTSQRRFVAEGTDTGWNTTSDGQWDDRVLSWDDLSGRNRTLWQLGTLSSRPKFVKATAIEGDNFVLKTPEDTGVLCGPEWDWGNVAALGGSRWAIRGWTSTVLLDPSCSQDDFYWEAAYTIGRPEPGFVSTLSGIDLVVSASNSQMLSELLMSDPPQYHDPTGGLTFFAVCRNRVFQTALLTKPNENKLFSTHGGHESLIFEAVGSWKFRMDGFVVQRAGSGDPQEFIGGGPLDIVTGSGPASPVGINWRVCGLRITPGDKIESFTSHGTLPFSIIATTSFPPAAMAGSTGYKAVTGHLECACLVMYNRALTDVEMGTVIAHLKSRYKVFHPPL